ncbi:MAG TPA: hypothetical protein VD706_02480 [Candidatus Saccharimonadales bacterium]|nr:hypothetical protein [Candidatus Saccharimonadales bacterium]
MLVLSFLSWWYGPGWKMVFNSLGPRMKSVSAGFSVVQLFRTLFQPWRRIISYPGASLDAKMRAWGDNMVSRAIGFFVRSSVLVAAFFTFIVVGLATILEVLVWPLLPLIIPGGIIGWFVL